MIKKPHGNCGRRHTKEEIVKMCIARQKRVGVLAPTYGKKLPPASEERKKKIGISNSGYKNGMWKGDDVGYMSLHLWVRDHLQQPELCEECSKTKSYDLANITGIYDRNFVNWKYLCRSCHMKLKKKKGIRI